jgi:large subunit ribosomal protein L21
MSHAVIKTGGKQFLVEEGQTLRVPSLTADTGSSVKLEALLTTASEAIKVSATCG